MQARQESFPMPSVPFTKPVEDSVPKIDNAVAVGEDLAFQKRWWTFERFIWVFFAFVLVADLSGILGRGPLAKAELHAPDRTLDLKYERVVRANTPSIMTVQFGSNAIQNGQVHLFVSQSLIKDLGTQRIAPQPANSAIGDGGITYTFSATGGPAVIELAMESSFPGRHHFSMQVPGGDSLQATVIVVP